MAIDFKRIFRNKNHWQRKINDLERLESRRWVKHCLTAMTLARCVGRGTGLNNDQLQNKLTVLQRALSQHKDITESLDVLATLLNQFNARI